MAAGPPEADAAAPTSAVPLPEANISGTTLLAALARGEQHRYRLDLQGGLIVTAEPGSSPLMVELHRSNPTEAQETGSLVMRQLLGDPAATSTPPGPVPGLPGGDAGAPTDPSRNLEVTALNPGPYDLVVALAGDEAGAYRLSVNGEGLWFRPALPRFTLSKDPPGEDGEKAQPSDPQTLHPVERASGMLAFWLQPPSATTPPPRSAPLQSEPEVVSLAVDGEVHAEAPGLPALLEADTRSLFEGLHQVTVTAVDGFGNQVVHSRQVLVDNWDTYQDLPPGHWARGDVELLADLAVVSGYPDGSFRPEQSVTRAEFARLVVGAAGLPAMAPEASETGEDAAFADVSPHDWYYAPVAAAQAAGAIQGQPAPDGRIRFRPRDPISRAEAAAILVRISGVTAVDLEPEGPTVLPFTDAAAIPAWARGFVLTAHRHGLLQGFPDGRFQPQGAVTRGQAAAMMARLLR